MKNLIKKIKAELKAARERSSTNNTYDYSYANGLEFALNEIMKVNDINKQKHIKQNVDKDIDFWIDAHEFLNSQLPNDFGDKMKEFVENKQYSQNDFRLFKYMIQEAIGFEASVILLKHFY